MKIANIFGLHIGCDISVKLKKEAMPTSLAGVFKGRGTGRYMIKTVDDFNIYIEHCKLLLKPLSKITDEDKQEFSKRFDSKNLKHFNIKIRKKPSGVDGVFIDYLLKSSGWFSIGLEYSDIIWLASKGYDIGIVPDEYKEVEQ